MDFSDNISFDEFAYFVFNDFQAFRGELPPFLADWGVFRLGEQLMHGDFWVSPGTSPYDQANTSEFFFKKSIKAIRNSSVSSVPIMT